MKRLLVVLLVAVLIGGLAGGLVAASAQGKGESDASRPVIHTDRGSVTGGPGRITGPVPAGAIWGSPEVPSVARLVLDVGELSIDDTVQVNARIGGQPFKVLSSAVIPPSGPETAFQVFEFAAEEFYFDAITDQSGVTVYYSVVWISE
jgi:hypothetical protein